MKFGVVSSILVFALVPMAVARPMPPTSRGAMTAPRMPPAASSLQAAAPEEMPPPASNAPTTSAEDNGPPASSPDDQDEGAPATGGQNSGGQDSGAPTSGGTAGGQGSGGQGFLNIIKQLINNLMKQLGLSSGNGMDSGLLSKMSSLIGA